MKFTLIKYISALMLFFFFSSRTQAQTFGFGCLGLSGFYAGISEEYYDAGGVNDFLSVSLTSNLAASSNNSLKFEKGTGYRIGGNLFRAKFNKVFITAKGYYQFLKEEKSTSNTSSGSTYNSKYALSLNHWGVAVDFGVNLFWILDWKVLEGNVMFYSGEFTTEDFKDNVLVSDTKYELDKTQVGYYIGSGLILHLVPDYLSVEGTVGFSFVKIESMKRIDNLGNEIFINKAIPGGGFGATVQLNVGFPL